MIATCPAANRIQDYVLGKLPEQESDELYGHLAGCESCQHQLEASDSLSDSFISQFMIGPDSESFQQEPALRHATDRAKDLAVLLGRATLGDMEPADLEGESKSYGKESLPRFIGEYQIDRVLGHGGMGTVYLGHHTKLDRAVALKVISGHRLADPKTQGRFAAEMKAVGRMSHPNIVVAYDARDVDGTAVLVTEFIDGLNVGSILRRVGRLSVADAAQIACDVARALVAIEDAGLIHRDVKPSNIMVSRSGQVKLLDLGLARLQDPNGDLHEPTATGQALGTVDYIAPEQINEGRNVDVRADIYALGCTLFRMLTGQAVFADTQYATAFAKMTAHVQIKPPSLSQVADNIPAPLVELVAQMLEKDPAHRPQTPKSLVERLSPFTKDADLSALVSQALTSEEQPRPLARVATTSAVQKSPQREAFFGGRWPWLIGAGFAGAFFGLAMAWLMGIEITIKHPDGTTTTLKVVNGSVVTIDEHGNAAVELSPSQTKSNGAMDPTVATNEGSTATNNARQTISEQRIQLLDTLADPAKSKLRPLAGIWSFEINEDGVKQEGFLILGRDQYSLFNIPTGEDRRGAWRTDDTVLPHSFDLQFPDGNGGFHLGVSRRFNRPGVSDDCLTVFLSRSEDSNSRPKIWDKDAIHFDLMRSDLAKIESVANADETDAIFRILEELLVEPKPNSGERSAATLELSAPLTKSSTAIDPMVATDEGSTAANNTRQTISEQRIQLLDTLSDPAKSKLHPLAGIWSFEINEHVKQEGFLILGREQYSFFGIPTGEDSRGAWRTDDTVYPPSFDLQFPDGNGGFHLGFSRRFNRPGASEDLLTVCLSRSEEKGSRPKIWDKDAIRLDLKRSDLASIESLANAEETDAIFRILDEVLAESKSTPEASTSPLIQQQNATGDQPNLEGLVSGSGGVSERSDSTPVDQQSTPRANQRIEGVWRFQNESRFQGAFLLLKNNQFAIVGQPQAKPNSTDEAQDQTAEFVDVAGKLEFDPTAKIPQLGLYFTAGGPMDPQLGICDFVRQRLPASSSPDAADSTAAILPSVGIVVDELRIWLAPPGKPRVTGPTFGGGIEYFSLIRLDISENQTEYALPAEFSDAVRTKWKAMSESAEDNLN